jgi:hypothetical protein
MGEENKYGGAGDPIKMLLEEALEKQTNAMMDNFAQILQWIPTGGVSTSNSHLLAAILISIFFFTSFPHKVFEPSILVATF